MPGPSAVDPLHISWDGPGRGRTSRDAGDRAGQQLVLARYPQLLGTSENCRRPSRACEGRPSLTVGIWCLGQPRYYLAVAVARVWRNSRSR